MTDKLFLIELFILLLIPYPIEGGGKGIFKKLEPTFSMSVFNWVDNSGAYSWHTHIYEVSYLTSDIFTSLMFFRIYFVFEAMLVFLPINKLYGKRVCHTEGFSPSFFF